MPIDEISAGYGVGKAVGGEKLDGCAVFVGRHETSRAAVRRPFALAPIILCWWQASIFMPTHVHLLIILWQSSLQHTTLRPPARGDESKTGAMVDATDQQVDGRRH
jgi:hypothetical protein